MLIGLDQLMIDALLQAILPLWEKILSHGQARSNMLSSVQVLKQNIEAWLLDVKDYGQALY